jgi:hypothetical protein
MQWTTKQKLCTSDLELLTVNLRPKYIPREFSNIFIHLVYISPDANKNVAADCIKETVNNMSDEKPHSLQVVLGDVNKCELAKQLPNFYQYVDCNTRNDSKLDLCFANVKAAYRSVKGLPLANSDHNVIYLQPIYIRKLEHQKLVRLSVKSYDNNSLETLKTCFDVTDWEIFIENSLHIDELTETVTDYINFCCDAILPQD